MQHKMTSKGPLPISAYIAQASNNFNCNLGSKSFYSGVYNVASDNTAKPMITMSFPFSDSNSMVKLWTTASTSNGTYLSLVENLLFRVAAGVPVYVGQGSNLTFGTLAITRTFTYINAVGSTPAKVIINYTSSTGITTSYSVRARVTHATTTPQTLTPLIDYRSNPVPQSFAYEKVRVCDFGQVKEYFHSIRVPLINTQYTLCNYPFTDASTNSTMTIELRIAAQSDNTADAYTLRVFYQFSCSANGLPVQRTKYVASGGGTMVMLDSFIVTAGTATSPPSVTGVLSFGLGATASCTAVSRVQQSTSL
jgi:hypothetical protein